MKKIVLMSCMLLTSSQATDFVKSWFEEGKAKGNVKYYFIETKIDKVTGSHTSAHANAVGGTLNFTTGNWNGFSTGATFMTTNGFALPNVVDTSILGRDNAVRQGLLPGDPVGQESFSVLGEAFIKYSYDDFNVLYGRQVVKTPLENAKDVRMLPSAVQGIFGDYTLEYGTTIGASYLTDFKQRTSDRFINIVKHALGDNTQKITGSDEGDVVVTDAVYKSERTELNIYNYYVQDFMNSVYVDAGFKNKLDSGWSYSAAAQYINQMSIGNADDNLVSNATFTGGKQISANEVGLKMDVGYQESKLGLGFTKVLSNNEQHDSLVLPWDGTPLYTNMITSNDL